MVRLFFQVLLLLLISGNCSSQQTALLYPKSNKSVPWPRKECNLSLHQQLPPVCEADVRLNFFTFDDDFTTSDFVLQSARFVSSCPDDDTASLALLFPMAFNKSLAAVMGMNWLDGDRPPMEKDVKRRALNSNLSDFEDIFSPWVSWSGRLNGDETQLIRNWRNDASMRYGLKNLRVLAMPVLISVSRCKLDETVKLQLKYYMESE